MPRRLSSCASITPRYCLCRAGKSSWHVCAAESGSVAALHVTCGFVMSDSRGGVSMKQTRQHGQKAECFLSSPLCMSESFSPRAAAASWPPSKGVAETVHMSSSDCLWCYLFKLPVFCVHLLEQTPHWLLPNQRSKVSSQQQRQIRSNASCYVAFVQNSHWIFFILRQLFSPLTSRDYLSWFLNSEFQKWRIYG